MNDGPGGQLTVPQQLIALLRDRSVETGSFTLASGAKSSYYIDARRTTMSAAGLRLVGKLGLQAIRTAGWDTRFVGGMTLGADPVAYAIAVASLADPPEIDAFTIRKQPKEHGLGRQIEGCFESAQPVVVVEDVLTTGQSAIGAIETVREAGGTVSGVMVVVDREQGGRERIEGLGIPVQALVSARDLEIGD